MEKEMIEKTCKKCKKILPEGYKYSRCEACRTAQVQKAKDVVKTVSGVIIAAVSIVGAVGATLAKKDDNEPEQKGDKNEK